MGILLAASPWPGLPALEPVGAALSNPIQIENALPGTRAWRLTNPISNRQIEGFAWSQSVAPGGTIAVSISTSAHQYTADIYRTGWYRGLGGRLVYASPKLPGYRRSTPKPNPGTGRIACDWPISFTVAVDDSWTTGIYLVKLTTQDAHHWQSYIPFVVTQDPAFPPSPLLMIHAVNTDEAYNVWGDTSLYADVTYHGYSEQYRHRAVMVSFHRPFVQNYGAGWFFSWEIHMLRWLERNGYDVSYATDLNINDDPSLLLGRAGVIVAGHDEYWSKAMRDGFDAAIRSGVGLANFGANTAYWQVRIQSLGDDPDGVMVCYKEFHRDPVHLRRPDLATIRWRDPPINRPESELTGAMYQAYLGSHGPYPWKISDPSSWLYAGSGAHPGQAVAGMVGPEEDSLIARDPSGTVYPRPANVVAIARSPVVDSYGRHHTSMSTLYRAASGAQVFNAGTEDWSYGLDDLREKAGWNWQYQPARKSPSPVVEAVTANILNEFLTQSQNGL